MDLVFLRWFIGEFTQKFWNIISKKLKAKNIYKGRSFQQI